MSVGNKEDISLFDDNFNKGSDNEGDDLSYPFGTDSVFSLGFDSYYGGDSNSSNADNDSSISVAHSEESEKAGSVDPRLVLEPGGTQNVCESTINTNLEIEAESGQPYFFIDGTVQHLFENNKLIYVTLQPRTSIKEHSLICKKNTLIEQHRQNVPDQQRGMCVWCF